MEIAAAAVRLGVTVFTPVVEHGRTDLVLGIGGRLWRVQCKWGPLHPKGDVVIITPGGSRWSARGYIRSTYDEDEIDRFGVYCGELDQCFLIPGEGRRRQVSTPPSTDASAERTACMYYPC